MIDCGEDTRDFKFSKSTDHQINRSQMYIYFKSVMERWSRGALLLILLAAGCGEGAKLVQETESGGIVTYPFKGDRGNVFTPFRAEALELIEKRCGGRYTIVKEAEARGRSRVVESAAGVQETIAERRWGIQFQCKGDNQ